MVRLDDVLRLERLDAGELKSDSWCLRLMLKLLKTVAEKTHAQQLFKLQSVFVLAQVGWNYVVTLPHPLLLPPSGDNFNASAIRARHPGTGRSSPSSWAAPWPSRAPSSPEEDCVGQRPLSASTMFQDRSLPGSVWDCLDLLAGHLDLYWPKQWCVVTAWPIVYYVKVEQIRTCQQQTQQTWALFFNKVVLGSGTSSVLFVLGPPVPGKTLFIKVGEPKIRCFFLSGDGEQGLWSLSHLPCAGGGEGGLGRPDWRTLAAPREDGGQVDLPPPQFYWPFGRDTWLGIRSGDMLNCFVIPYATYWTPWYTTVCCSIAFRRKRYVPFSVEWGPYLLFVGRLFVLYPL